MPTFRRQLAKAHAACLVLLKILVLPVPHAHAQDHQSLVSSYYFTGNARDSVSDNHGIVRGPTLTNDRFGNPGAAYSFDGENDYLTLGTNSDLKLVEMSISLWMKVNDFSSNRHRYNGMVFLSTRARESEEYYEAYAVGVYLDPAKVGAACSSRQQEQSGCIAREPVKAGVWYHVVFMFNTDSLYLYVNGVFQQKNYKGFISNYFPSDSVLLGYVTNYFVGRKGYNYSYFNGCLDDVKLYSKVLTPAEILQLYNEPDPKLAAKAETPISWEQIRKLLARLWYIPSALLLFLVAFILNQRRLRAIRRREKERMQLEHKLLEMEVRVIRNQMNPHFISNCLAAIQNLILTKEIDKAGQYLAKFSYFMRQVLENSEKVHLSLREELEIVRLNVELEQLRFKDSFKFTLEVDQKVNTSDVFVPSLITQPFIENAIWHGLLPLRQGDPELNVNVYPHQQHVVIEIRDNGVGRSANGTSHRKASKGTRLAMEKIESVNRLMASDDHRLNIIDLFNESGKPAGTQVVIEIANNGKD